MAPVSGQFMQMHAAAPTMIAGAAPAGGPPPPPPPGGGGPINLWGVGSLGATLVGSGYGGYSEGLIKPEAHTFSPGALINSALTALPGAAMGGPRGAALAAALGFLSYRAGHGMGRQAASDYMRGPGYNANTANFRRSPTVEEAGAVLAASNLL